MNISSTRPKRVIPIFDMPKEVWKILDTPDEAWKAVNRQFVVNQIEQGKRFLGKLLDGKPRGKGLQFELEILSEMGRKIRWLE
jgi:hypothetical protein